ncbi:MAG: hypothetical protein B7C54_11320 [Acidimicrobiales bacterium mtb01]|nr:hypothetical protein [Actinomycetota bacterium]TEX45639.1 MAG: hypothetical protein B7C54_11320 [Acidimicrobiales bacterium mtb01]
MKRRSSSSRLFLTWALIASAIALAAAIPVSAAANPALIWVDYVNPTGNVLSHSTIDAAVEDTFVLENRRNNDNGVSYVSIVNGTGSVTLNGVACAADASCRVFDETGSDPSNQGVFAVVSAGTLTVRRFLNGSGTTTVGTLTVAAVATGTGGTKSLKGTFDANGGTCFLAAGVRDTVTSSVPANGRMSAWAYHSVSPLYVYAPGAAECTKAESVFAGWALATSPTVSAGLPLLRHEVEGQTPVWRHFVGSNCGTGVGCDYVAMWAVAPRWVADGTHRGLFPLLGAFGETVTMSDDGNTVAAGGFLTVPQILARNDTSSQWSVMWTGPANPPFVSFSSSLAMSGNGRSAFLGYGYLLFQDFGAFRMNHDIRLASSQSGQWSWSGWGQPATLEGSGRKFATDSTGLRYLFSDGLGQVSVFDGSSLRTISGESEGDQFGSSISMSGDGSTIVVGSPLNDGNGVDAGSVRVFSFSNGGWVQKGVDIDGQRAGDRFGSSVAVSADGSTVVVGAPFNDGNGVDAGSVRVFTFSNGAWAQRGGDIGGELARGRAGHAVAVSSDGGTVAIGAPFVGRSYDDCLAGDAVFDRNGNRDCMEAGQVLVRSWSGSTWTPVGQSILGGSRSQLGWSVDISADGSTLVAGAPRAGYASIGTIAGLVSRGEVRMYRLDGA